MQVFIREVGDVAADEDVDVFIEGRGREGIRPGYTRIPLVFSSGREIRTNVSNEFATFCRRIELIDHREAVFRHVAAHAGVDAAPQPRLRVQPQFSDEVDSATIPERVSAQFFILADGTVDRVMLPAGLLPDVTWEIGRALRAWLFLPMVSNGQPQHASGTLSVRIARELRAEQ